METEKTLVSMVKSQFETLTPARVNNVVAKLQEMEDKLKYLDRGTMDILIKHLVNVETATHFAAAGKKNADSILETKVKALNKFLTLHNI
jgi:citrate lyase gamma subunit